MRGNRSAMAQLSPPSSSTTNRIAGGFRPITTHQLALAWWLYQSSEITRRQLRVYFAAHEMAERRRAAGPSGARQRPNYRLEEVLSLVGGRGTPTAPQELTADIRRLRRVGLVDISPHAIVFAVSADQIKVESLTAFWTFFAQLPNSGRTVPIPRRTLRALAAGFSRAVTAVMIATLIRSVFWHRTTGYRFDGRTKGTWIADAFGISRRAVTDGRRRLIELGWLEPLATPQWALNRWGAHDAVAAAWSPPTAVEKQEAGQGNSASPKTDLPGQSASPDLNSPASPSENLNTKTRTSGEPESLGVLQQTTKGKNAAQELPAPTLRDVRREHLARMPDLLTLYEQAVKAGLGRAGEAGQLDFIAFAERALAHGQRPGALFLWLLRGQRREYITQADENAALRRLQEHRRAGEAQAPRSLPVRSTEPELSEDERIYLVCVQAAKQHRIEDPFRVAFMTKNWTRDRWDQVRAAYERTKRERLGGAGNDWNRISFPIGSGVCRA